jgi:hypothetical protein
MDAMFLSMEGATAWPQHTLGLMILDPGSVADFGFDALRNHVESKLHVYWAAHLEQRLPLNTNLIVSNVPGPPSRLYLAGARIEHIVPVGPLAVGMGMNVTVFSYGDYVDVGVQVDPELVDDAWELVSHATEELDRLVVATADG